MAIDKGIDVQLLVPLGLQIDGIRQTIEPANSYLKENTTLLTPQIKSLIVSQKKDMEGYGG